jgi:predicted small integral membrane protein
MSEGFLRHLPFETTLGDRIFLSVALSISVFLIWMAIIGGSQGSLPQQPIPLIPPLVVSIVISAILVFKG